MDDAMADLGKVELRGDIERDIIDVLDAVAKAKRRSRMEVVEQALREWADGKLHESTLVVRLARGQGSKREG
jgi:predicted transcriptional regulator